MLGNLGFGSLICENGAPTLSSATLSLTEKIAKAMTQKFTASRSLTDFMCNGVMLDSRQFAVEVQQPELEKGLISFSRRIALMPVG